MNKIKFINNIITIIILILFNSKGFSQISTDLPVLAPQTPTTNELGKYGDIIINESTGKISPSIPLLNYKAGDFEIPITINYSGNGVKVNQDPTWAGLNWNINASGVITRQVKDRPDELTSNQNRLYLSGQDLDNLNGANTSTPLYSNGNLIGYYPFTSSQWYQTLISIQNDAIVDSETDIFNFNFMGYNGSFYLDKNNNVRIIKKNKELSIIFLFDASNSNKSEFIIKTENGDTYLFGGPNASESSRTWVNNGSGSTSNIPFAQNSFYLYKILFFNGGHVSFTYENYDSTCDYYKIGIVESASISSPLTAISPCNKTVKTLYGEIQNAVYLKEISNSFNPHKIVFNTSFTGKCNRLIKLNQVSFLSNTTQIKKVKLNYLTIDNEPNTSQNEFIDEDKFFLEKVEFFDKNNQFVNDYQLIYNNPELLPSKKSFAQDHLGYYNGKNINTTLLPVTTNTLLNNGCGFGLADRRANLQSSLIGSLSKIIYPTGGYNEFEYELPYDGQVDKIENRFCSVYYRDEYRNYTSSAYTFTNNYHTYTTHYYPDGGDGALLLSSTKTINFTLNVMSKGCFTNQNNIKIVALKLVNNSYVTAASYVKTLTNSDCTNLYESINSSFNLSAGNYIFRISINLVNAANTNTNSVIGNFQLQLPVGTESVYYPGLRIKNVKSNDGNNVVNTVRYYYNTKNKINLETVNFNPNYVSRVVVKASSSATGIGYEKFYLAANNINSVYVGSESSDFLYGNVTVSYGGDNFENGGKESEFYKVNDSPYEIYNFQIPNAPPYDNSVYGYINDANTNYSYPNSTLLTENYFDNQLKTLKEVKYNYLGEETFSINNLKAYRMIEGQNSALPVFESLFFLFQKKSFNYRLVSTETKEYPNVNDINAFIQNTTNLTYSPDKVSLPSLITSTNSSGEITTTKIYYPSEVNSIPSYNSNDVTTINNMATIRHNVSAVIRTESRKNHILLGTKQVYFNSQGLPNKICSFKGELENNLEERVIIESYHNGKPSLVSLKDGTKIKYVYNNNLQVILKIENYSSSVEPDGTFDGCSAQQAYPNSMVTKYDYDSITHNLIRITDPKCDIITYHYDNFNRLKEVRDKDNNILSENKYNYRTQN